MRTVLLALLLGACQSDGVLERDPTTDTGAVQEEGPDMHEVPVLLIHGINGSAANYDVMVGRLADAGWSDVYAYTFDDPSWGCNLDNAFTIAGWVDDIRAETGAERIGLVAHSMGTLSSRYYVKNLGGIETVHTYATLGGMHHGLPSACSPDFPFKPCIWDEICSDGEFVAQLNEDPSTPGELHWVSIYGTADESVPNWSSHLEGAENIEMPGVEHDGPEGLLQDEGTWLELEQVLLQP